MLKLAVLGRSPEPAISSIRSLACWKPPLRVTRALSMMLQELTSRLLLLFISLKVLIASSRQPAATAASSSPLPLWPLASSVPRSCSNSCSRSSSSSHSRSRWARHCGLCPSGAARKQRVARGRSHAASAQGKMRRQSSSGAASASLKISQARTGHFGPKISRQFSATRDRCRKAQPKINSSAESSAPGSSLRRASSAEGC
mmetsp:Transcript_98762/g.235410  ORF Transcript_98762/g.235410 Transcript_98762/m.235410 type:complete len:201 (+) Transcript_98762:484-1086(+)